jgi:hypothetical protein
MSKYFLYTSTTRVAADFRKSPILFEIDQGFSLGDHHRSEATLACLILVKR